jgi:hypothetical protein
MCGIWSGRRTLVVHISILSRNVAMCAGNYKRKEGVRKRMKRAQRRKREKNKEK